MTRRTVLTDPNDELRIPSESIDVSEIGSKELNMLIDDLIETMNAENGIGIAAPQIGVHKRVIIVDDGKGPEAYINPVIIGRSLRTGEFVDEGCLSVPGVWGYVKRHRTVRVKALTRTGKEIVLKAEKLPSVIFQHEIDHLDGMLFIDKVTEYTKHPKMQL